MCSLFDIDNHVDVDIDWACQVDGQVVWQVVACQADGQEVNSGGFHW